MVGGEAQTQMGRPRPPREGDRQQGRACQSTKNVTQSGPFTSWGLGTGDRVLMWHVGPEPQPQESWSTAGACPAPGVLTQTLSMLDSSLRLAFRDLSSACAGDGEDAARDSEPRESGPPFWEAEGNKLYL